MGFNEFLSSIFGNKSTRDMKEIQPWVEKIKAAYPEVAKLDNDALRAKTEELKAYIHDSAAEQRAKVEELKASVEDTELEKREDLFNQIDKIEKEILEIYEKALDEVLPTAFSIVKETAKRFSENEEIVVTATDFDRQLAATKDFVRIEGDKAIYQNHWIAGGNDTVWNMVHYDVQLFGGVVLHKGKIAEMATGEGKTLVATLPVFLNALTGNGVHVVTVNDYLAKRDSEWMGPLYMFHGLSVDCIDKHQPNSDARRKAYLADITFGTNNEFGFDYLRDNMAISPKDLVQRQHNYAIVDEVDSVLIDDARTPLIISGPVPKGDDQLFEQLRPQVERLVEAQKKLATQYLADAKRLIASNDKKDQEEGFLALYRSHKCLPKNKALIKFLSEQGIKAGMLKTEEIYMEQNNKRMHEVTDPLYFVIEEKMNSVDLTDKGVDLISSNVEDPTFFVLPDITAQLSALENETELTDEQRLEKKDALMTNYAIKSERVHTINQLLKAYTMFEKDDEYVVIDGQVKIVDVLQTLAMEVPFTEEEFRNEKKEKLADRTFDAAMELFKRKTERMAQIAYPVIKQVYETQGHMYENILIPITDGKRMYNISCNLKRAYETECKEVVKSFEKSILLHVIDEAWKENLRELDELKHSVQNASYEQKDPLLIYKLESVNLFDAMVNKINNQTISILMRGQIPVQEAPAEAPEAPQAPRQVEVRQAAPEQRQDMSKYREQKVDLNDPNQQAAAAQDTREQPRREPIRAEKTVGRNDPCPCGSGKKYKNCHGRNA